MASAAQIAANQANAARSTGPRTANGKAASARNSTTHGLSSSDFVVLAGQEQEFSEFVDALRNEIQPVGAIELDLFTQHAHASWTLRRCRRAEVASQFDDICKGGDPLLYFDMAHRLRRIDLYMRRAERTYYKTLKALKDFQTNRLSSEIVDPLMDTVQPPPPPALVEPAQLYRQRSAIARAQASSDSACGDAVFQDALLRFSADSAQRLHAEADKRTQSGEPATHAAGAAR